MSSSDRRPRALLVGGGGGLVGRAALPELAREFQVRSVHRHPVPAESELGVDWVKADAVRVQNWGPLVEDVDVVVVLAWYRAPYDRRFVRLADSLTRLVDAAGNSAVRRIVHVSVPDAPASLENQLPYLTEKRRVDRAVAAGRTPYSIVRPTMLFGPRDRLLTVMLRLMRRYHRFPMFGDGQYHVSPISTLDLAEILRREAHQTGGRTVLAGGPTRYVYRDLTDRMFAALDRSPKYVHFSARAALWLAQLVEGVGSTLLYAYEVEWLLSDRLGLPPYDGLSHPLRPVEPFLAAEAGRLAGRVASDRG